MVNLITFLVIAAIVGGAGLYIYKAKKSGVKCIGCPSAKACGQQGMTGCSGSCASCSGCSHHK
ncbi:MAG: FeoB-associated Cys-rich membrane protein [Firmicutes bacterium]|nr:FeoB-associated Cys-rich membrane protein [Bacillota bacterium]